MSAGAAEPLTPCTVLDKRCSVAEIAGEITTGTICAYDYGVIRAVQITDSVYPVEPVAVKQATIGIDIKVAIAVLTSGEGTAAVSNNIMPIISNPEPNTSST